MGDDDVYDLRWFLVLKGLIPTSLLLQLEEYWSTDQNTQHFNSVEFAVAH